MDETDASHGRFAIQGLDGVQLNARPNAFAETWIESHKRECLNHFICFSLNQLDYIKTTWVTYYNTLRPHRGVGMTNDVLDETFEPQTEGRVRCRSELGGIIKSYYRDAA